MRVKTEKTENMLSRIKIIKYAKYILCKTKFRFLDYRDNGLPKKICEIIITS